MFYMKIEHQLNLNDRTLLSGKPTYDSVPKMIEADNMKFKVTGISSGIKPPYVSLEIEKTDLNLTGKEIRACQIHLV